MFSIVVIREGAVHYKRLKSPIRFSTYKELMEKIERDEKWLIDLKFSYFRIFYEVNQNLHEMPQDFIGVPTEKVKIVADRKSKGFSTAALKPVEALSSLHSLYKSVGQIPRSDDMFPECTKLSQEHLDAAVTALVATLKDRAKAINLEIASEYTMREFISPVLVAVVNLVIDYRAALSESSSDPSKLSLVGERILLGMNAQGPVDYTILFDFVDLVLSEAKKTALETGVVQCLLQQRAGQEVLSNTIKLDLVSPDPKTVSKLVSRIVNIVLNQIEKVKDSEDLQNAAKSFFRERAVTNIDRTKSFVALQTTIAKEIEANDIEVEVEVEVVHL